LDRDCIVGVALKSSGNTAVAISLSRGAIKNVEALALRLRKNLASDNGVDESSVNGPIADHSLVLFCLIIEHLSGGIDNCGDSAVNCASSAVAAIVSSKDIASAAESIRVEGAHWGRRDNDVEQAASALLEGGAWASHAAAV
jgi:hypothetical protein